MKPPFVVFAGKANKAKIPEKLELILANHDVGQPRIISYETMTKSEIELVCNKHGTREVRSLAAWVLMSTRSRCLMKCCQVADKQANREQYASKAREKLEAIAATRQHQISNFKYKPTRQGGCTFSLFCLRHNMYFPIVNARRYQYSKISEGVICCMRASRQKEQEPPPS